MKKNFPLQKIIPFGEQYISRDIFNYITKSCTFPPIAIEEVNSELWCYSYDGYGKVTFKDGSVECSAGGKTACSPKDCADIYNSLLN